MAKYSNVVQEISEREAQLDVIRRSQVCHLGMVDEGLPYVLPFNFGFEDPYIYLHSSFVGRKIETLKKNNNVCLSFSLDYDLFKQNEAVACSWSMKYRSVMVFGKVFFVDDINEKRKAMDSVMKQFSTESFTYSDAAINHVCVMRVEIDKITGRSFRY